MEVAMEVLAGHLFTYLCVAAMQFFVCGCGRTVVLATFRVWVWVGTDPRDFCVWSSPYGTVNAHMSNLVSCTRTCDRNTNMV